MLEENQNPTIDEQQVGFMQDMMGITSEGGNNLEDDNKDQKGDLEIDDQGDEQQNLDQQNQDQDQQADQSADQQADQDQQQDVDHNAVIESLRAQVVELMDQINKDPLHQTVKADVTDQNQKQNQDQQSQQEAQDILAAFLSAEELDQVIDKPELLNTAFQRSQKALMATIPQIIQAEVNRQIVVQKAISDFYTANSDLLPYAKFVQYTMAEVEDKNRDKTYAEIFETTANECRKRLGLSAPAQQQRQNRQPNNGQKRPAFAGSKQNTGRPAGQKEIFDENARDMLPA